MIKCRMAGWSSADKVFATPHGSSVLLTVRAIMAATPAIDYGKPVTPYGVLWLGDVGIEPHPLIVAKSGVVDFYC